jgi:signal transduction histidine kinase/CheY-like chemotaxis protein/HPt (histidine-containing phosphotransfer) domain-containing protein
LLPDPLDLSKTLDAVPYITLILDRDRTTRHVNEAGRRWIGEPDGVGRKCHHILRGRDAPCPDCPLEAVFDKGTPAFLAPPAGEGEVSGTLVFYPLLRGDGEVTAVIHTLVPRPASAPAESALDGAEEDLIRRAKIEGTVLEIANILARERALDEGLGKTLKILGMAVDASRAFIYLLAPDGRDIRRISEWAAPGAPPGSEATRELAVQDYPRWGETLFGGQPILVTDVAEIPPEDTAAREALQADATRAAAFFPMFSKNEPIGFLGLDDTRGPRAWSDGDLRLLRLVSEVFTAYLVRMEGERAEREARRIAETADRAKTEFLTNMSHEIRTPLTGIIGMIDLASETDPNPAQREFLSLAKASAETLLGLLGGILDLAKIEAGTFDLESRPFGVGAVVEETAGTVSLRAQEKGLDVVLFVDPRIPAPLMGDARRLRQILENLLDNAVKFTERGEVIVRADLEAREESDAFVRFTVRDTGVGVPEESLEIIFSSFSQADGSSARRFGGTGLGLAISRQIAGMMGGTIEVDSRPGQGSIFRFTVRFPLAPGARAGDADFGRSCGRVLVAESHETSRRLLKDLLEAWGCDVDETSSGEETLRRVEEAVESGPPIERVLLDTRLSEGEGIALAAKLQKAGQPPGKIVLMQTGVRRKSDSTRWLANPEIRRLMKPLRPSAVRDLLRTSADAGGGLKGAGAPAQEKPSRFLRVLVAEDNLVNRKLVATLLSRQGWEVEAVPDGRSALDALERRPFDAVLMDIQMPVMDGIEVTRVIREAEEKTRDHVPIIAVTAHAMTEDRDRCLQAGMDDYIAKPLRAPDLIRVLEKWARRPRGEDAAGRPAPINFDDIHSRLGIEFDLVLDMLEILLEDAPGHVKRIEEALAGRDTTALAAAAHRLKGAAGNLGAEPLFEAAKAIEAMGRGGDLDGASARFPAMQEEMRRIAQFVKEQRGSPGGTAD